MKRNCLTILIVLFYCAACFAQRERIDSLLAAVKNPLPDSTMMRCYLKLGRAYADISIDSSAGYAAKGQRLAAKLHNRKAEAEGYSILGRNEKDKGNYSKALGYQLQALKIREALQDDRGLASTNNDVGMLYRSMKRYPEARAYYRTANSYCRKIGLGKGIALSYNNIGTTFWELHETDSAFWYYTAGLKEAENTQDPYVLATCLTNLGDVYSYQDMYDKALAVFRRCLEYDKQTEDKRGIVISYSNVARSLGSLKNYAAAVKYSDSSIELATREQLKSEMLEAIRVRADIERTHGNYLRAFEFQTRFIAIKDTMLSQETQNEISEMQTRYETEKKEQKIRLQRSEIRRKNFQIAGIAGFMCLGGLLGVSHYRRRRLKQQSKLQEAIIYQQELASRAVIEAEERERKRIAGDLHDGVGQLMSAVKMNLSGIGSELKFETEEQRLAFDKAISLVDEGCREVRTVSHAIMPNALLKAGLASAVRESINRLDQRVLQVNLYSEGLNERIDGNVESVLYRVIQECVNNVIKHSGASRLDLSLIRDEEGISVTIEDNGKGFDASDKALSEGIGIKNIQSRVNYLKGLVEWDASPGKGTVVTIQVPV